MFFITTSSQVSADIGVCVFGVEKGAFNFHEPHNCKNGDTAIWRGSNDTTIAHMKHFFKAQNCNINGKFLEGVSKDLFFGGENEEHYIICEFQKKVERNID